MSRKPRYKPSKKEVRKCAWGQRLLEPALSDRAGGRGKAGVNDEREKPTASNCRLRGPLSSPGCQVTENDELTKVVRQFVRANRAPNQTPKDFHHFFH